MARQSSTAKKGAARARGGSKDASEGGRNLRGNASRAQQQEPPAPQPLQEDGAGQDIAGVVLAVVAVASFIAVMSSSTAPVTSAISAFYHLGFGLGAYVLPFAVLAVAVGLFLRERSPLSGRTLAGIALVFVAVLALLSLSVPYTSLSTAAMFDEDNLSRYGGYVGAFIASVLQNAFGKAISRVILVGVIVGGLVIIGFSVGDLLQELMARVQEAASRHRVAVNDLPWGGSDGAAQPVQGGAARQAPLGRHGTGAKAEQPDEDIAPTSYLGARETTAIDRFPDAAERADEDAEADEDPFVNVAGQLEAERAKTLLIPVKDRFYDNGGSEPREIPIRGEYAAPAAASADLDALVTLRIPEAGEQAAGSGEGAETAGETGAALRSPAEASAADVLPADVGAAATDAGTAAQEQTPVDLPQVDAGSIPDFLLNPSKRRSAPVPPEPAPAEPAASEPPEPAPAPIPRERPATATVQLADGDGDEEPARAGTQAPPPRRLPPMSMLRHNPNSASAASSNQELEQTAEALQATLAEFNLRARVTGWISGPTVTTFKVQPGEGERVSRISNLEDDIALSLAAQSVRIFAPIPGTSLVGIEIPNRKRQNVNLADVLPYVQGGPLELAIGRDAEGNPVVADLAKMPHLLIAGTTGSGKSVMINSIVMTLLMRTVPEQVRLIMVDPKRVELAGYNGLPHLYVPVVTEPKQAASALQWAVSEMERRLKVFERLSVRKISTYNEKQAAGEFAHYDNPPQQMPYLVIIIDELSDLMMVAGKDVEASIVRIAQLGRAAGVHLIVATQRPSSNVVTGLIKANITNRIAFNVATGVDSRVIIDQVGAEKLTGLGDMLFSKVGWGKPKRIQGCFVSDEEIAQVVEFVKDQGGTDYHEEILSAVAPATIGSAQAAAPSEDDPLLWNAAHIVVESQLGSTSGLQRRLKVGYARAGRIMDMLEEKGVVGPPDGSKPREVLLDEEGLAALEALEGPLSAEDLEG